MSRPYVDLIRNYPPRSAVSTRIKCLQCAVRRTGPCRALTTATANDLAKIVHRRRIPAGQVLYGGANHQKTFSIIVDGVVKLVNMQPDGGNQIVGLQFPSDFVGRPFADDAGMIAEAATDLDVCAFSGSAFENLMQTHPDLERTIFQRTLDDLDAARQWMFMIARKTAEERVASLLVLIARKLKGETVDDAAPVSDLEFALPLSRTEIAECLGLRLETVSRQFAALKAEGVIATGRRRGIKVCDLTSLAARAQGHAPLMA
jgi:CRP/FNR family transcriptional regulator